MTNPQDMVEIKRADLQDIWGYINGERLLGRYPMPERLLDAIEEVLKSKG